MSNARFCIIPARALGDTRISRNDVMVLLALGKFGDKDGWSWPSMKTIAEMIQAHHVSVSKSIKTLIDCGYVEARPRYRDDGSQTSNEYRIMFDAPAEQTALDFESEENQSADATPIAATLPPHSGAAIPPIASEAMPPIAHTLCLMKEPTLTPQMNKELSPTEVVEGKCVKKYPDDFESFWNLWPKERRCEKPEAFKAWRSSHDKIHPDALLAAVKRYLLTKEAVAGFVPYPAKWLKRERWLEFPDTSAPEMPQELSTAMLGGDSKDNRLLLAMLTDLRSNHGEAIYRSWLSGLRIGAVGDGGVIFTVPTKFVAEWIANHFGAEIETLARTLWNCEAVKIMAVTHFHGARKMEYA